MNTKINKHKFEINKLVILVIKAKHKICIKTLSDKTD